MTDIGPLDRIRRALAMHKAGCSWQVDPEDIEILLSGYEAFAARNTPVGWGDDYPKDQS